MWLISFSSILANHFPNYLGILIWLVGFYFESTADAQLKNFLNDPLNKGKIMDQGLWTYSRHPNYFGEVTMWWGIWLISGNIYAIISPVTITTLILFVSGIPMLEKKYLGDPEFEKYILRTSVFFPLPPRRPLQG